jgi:hypothetical protein
MNIRLALPILVLSAFFHPIVALAQWQPDGVAVSVAPNDRSVPSIVSDGAGGAIMAWRDHRSAPLYDVYAQRVDASGVPLWTANGVAICTGTADSNSPAVIVTDGAGGAIVTWSDNRNGITNEDVYAQRVDASGVVQWTANGVPVGAFTNNQLYPTMMADGAGGAIIAWWDLRNGNNYDTYAQRINASGAVQWTPNGVALCTVFYDQINQTLVSDGTGGAIVTWEDHRNNLYDIYAQRVNASGAVLWTAGGIPLCVATALQYNPMIVSDAGGGAIVTWYDQRAGNSDIYAQRVNSSGATQWPANGVALCALAQDQVFPTLVTDGAGGAIVTWYDYRSGTSYDIYAQRVTASGALQWAANGVPLCTAPNGQDTPTIVSDGAGGAVVAWEDGRSGNYDIYAQRIDGSGAVQWAANGVALCTAINNQFTSPIVSDGAGGAIMTWYDNRSGLANIYAQRVDMTYGYWGHPEPIVTSVADIPHDQGGKVALNWTASGRDHPVPATIDFYSVWRAVDTAPLGTSANEEIAVTPLERVTAGTAPGVRTILPGSPYYWELVGTQAAYRLPRYSFSAATRADSLAGNAGNEFFMVTAHDRTDPHIAFSSNAVSGHSVDNLAPSAPLYLIAQRVGSDVHLKWNRVRVPDLKDYSIYRKPSSGVTPVPVNFLVSANDTVLTDAGAPTSALYYIVTAYDVHANQSKPSNEASVSGATGAGNLPPIAALTVLQNHPNPFTGTTQLDIGLPANADVRIEMYDVAGRKVREQTLAAQKSGWRSVAFDGRDDRGRPLASGVYFYRVHAGSETVTRKIVIAR